MREQVNLRLLPIDYDDVPQDRPCITLNKNGIIGSPGYPFPKKENPTPDDLQYMALYAVQQRLPQVGEWYIDPDGKIRLNEGDDDREATKHMLAAGVEVILMTTDTTLTRRANNKVEHMHKALRDWFIKDQGQHPVAFLDTKQGTWWTEEDEKPKPTLEQLAEAYSDRDDLIVDSGSNAYSSQTIEAAFIAGANSAGQYTTGQVLDILNAYDEVKWGQSRRVSIVEIRDWFKGYLLSQQK